MDIKLRYRYEFDNAEDWVRLIDMKTVKMVEEPHSYVDGIFFLLGISNQFEITYPTYEEE